MRLSPTRQQTTAKEKVVSIHGARCHHPDGESECGIRMPCPRHEPSRPVSPPPNQETPERK